MTPRAVYDSAFHHPLVAYAIGLVTLLLLARRLGFLYGYVAVFLVEILADATVTGALSPIPSGTTAYTVGSVVFVILGDFRYFLLLERVARPAESLGRVVARALAISLIVPLGSGIASRFVPAMAADDRVLYLVYELAAFALVVVLARRRLATTSAEPEERTFLRRVTALFAGLYAGWAAADVIILAGAEVGHLIRIVPNVLYYAVFVPFVLVTAPDSLARRWPGARGASGVA